MVELHNLSIGNCLTEISCRVETGSITALILGREIAGEQLIRVLLGMHEADAGSVRVLGRDPAELPAEERLSLRQQIGVVFPDGGLIANLRVRDNVTLPLAYHSRLTGAEIEEMAVAALKRVGYAGSLSELPGNLPLHSRRLVGFARLLLIRPPLVIYHGTFEGLLAGERGKLIQVATEFHKEMPERTSLIVTAHPPSLEGLAVDSSFRLNGG